MQENGINITSLDEVVPAEGALTARIFENENIGLDPTLFFDILIPLQPFQFKGEDVSTSVSLEFIQLSIVADWREIAGQSYDFPVDPEEGCIDGSLYLEDAHNPADATRIAFGTIESGRISCRVEITFDFTCEGPEELGTPTLLWDVQLAIDEGELDRVLAEARKLLN